MAWESTSKKHLLDITRESKDGEESESSQEYEFGEKHSSSTINLRLFKKDAEVTIVPFFLEELKNKINLEGELITISELFVALRDDKTVSYIGYSFTNNDDSSEETLQYFFDTYGNPDKFKYNGELEYEWPPGRCAMIDGELKPFFENLKSLRPAASFSIDCCVEQLSVHGPDYYK